MATKQRTFGEVDVRETKSGAKCDKTIHPDADNYGEMICGNKAKIIIINMGEKNTYRCLQCAKQTWIDMAGVDE